MLTPDQLKPFLLHEDQFVRSTVAEYFGDAWSRDPELVPSILEACDRYGTERNRRLLSHCPRFPLDAASLDAILNLLARTEDPRAIEQLNRIVAGAPVELLAEREDRFRTPRLEPRTARRIRRSLDLATWTAERVWQRLQDFARRCDRRSDTDDVDFELGDDLVDALARLNSPDPEEHIRLLRRFGSTEQWIGILLIELAGARRLREAIPILVDLLYVDSDELLDCCPVALAKIGDPEAIRLIRAAFGSASDQFKSDTSDLLGSIKHPESEEAILALLETESDRETRTNLCFGLCRLFSERGIPVVLREIASGYEDWIVDLEEELLPVAEVLGVPLPDAERWRAEREERYREQERRASGWDLPGTRTLDSSGSRSDSFEEPQTVRGPGSEAIPPIRRTEPKVGRNDPCPCGSGKKYKKCCGNAPG